MCIIVFNYNNILILTFCTNNSNIRHEICKSFIYILPLSINFSIFVIIIMYFVNTNIFRNIKLSASKHKKQQKTTNYDKSICGCCAKCMAIGYTSRHLA